ncbi:MAG: glutathione peroxidase, partial [Paraclostridium sp.]
FLKEESPTAKEDDASKGLYEKLSGLGFKTDGNDIKWNFTKFLVDKEGNVVARFAPTFEPEKLEEEISKLL